MTHNISILNGVGKENKKGKGLREFHLHLWKIGWQKKLAAVGCGRREGFWLACVRREGKEFAEQGGKREISKNSHKGSIVISHGWGVHGTHVGYISSDLVPNLNEGRTLKTFKSYRM